MFFSESRLSRRSTLLYYAAVALNLKENFFKDISVQRHVKKREREREKEERVLNIGEVFGKLAATKATFLIIAFFFCVARSKSSTSLVTSYSMLYHIVE